LDADQTPSKGDPGWFQNFANLTDFVGCDRKDCSEEATVYFTTKCCRAVTFNCREDSEKYLAFLFIKQKEGYTMQCQNCQTRAYPMMYLNKAKRLRLDA
jgi:hypothetical protein